MSHALQSKGSTKKISLTLEPKPKFIGFSAAMMEFELASSALWKVIHRENKEREANGKPPIIRQDDLYDRADLFAAIKNQRRPAAEIEQEAIAKGLIRLSTRADEYSIKRPTFRRRCEQHGIKIVTLRTVPPPKRFEPGNANVYEGWIDDEKSLPIAQREVRNPTPDPTVDAEGSWWSVTPALKILKDEKVTSDRRTLENWADGTMPAPGGSKPARKLVQGIWKYLEFGKVTHDGEAKVGLREVAVSWRDTPPLPPLEDKTGKWYPVDTAVERTGWARDFFDRWRSGIKEAPGIGPFILNTHGKVDQWRGRDVWFFHETALATIRDALDYIKSAKTYPVRYPAGKTGKVYLHSKIVLKFTGASSEATLHKWDKEIKPLPDGLQLKRHQLPGLDGLFCLKSETTAVRNALLRHARHRRVPDGLKAKIDVEEILRHVIDHRDLPGLMAPKRGKRWAGNAQTARTPVRGRDPRRYEKPVLMALKGIYPELVDQTALGKKCQPTLSDKTVRECLKALRIAGLTTQPYGDRKGDRITPAGRAYLERLQH